MRIGALNPPLYITLFQAWKWLDEPLEIDPSRHRHDAITPNPQVDCPMHALKRLLFANLIGFVLATASFAGSVTGIVRDSDSQRPLPNATVVIESIGRSSTTDRSGAFSIPNVPAGTYQVTVRYLGLEDSSQSVTVGDVAATRADFDMGYGDVIKLENFVVEGIREGQARALQQKRTAENIIDIVSADALGKFPDGNAAESLRRMPGLSVEIDQDEGRYVVIRGIDSALNNVTLNNQVLGTPSEQGNRGVAMDSVPADLISRLEVSKAVTPDQDGTAIGGSINIVTKSAFEVPGQFLYGTVAGFYDNFSGRYSPNGSLTWGRVLGAEGKWGVVAAASYSKKRFQSQTSDNVGWAKINGFWMPTTQESFNYDIMRERIGVNVALQNRPNEDTEISLRLNHNEFTDEEGRNLAGFDFFQGETRVSNQTETSGTNSRGRATREFRSYHQTGTIDA
ncbi:MAG TPA: carboxypeptidase regulatory-like domain-containing protein, partial [Opitutaceae bacterium]